MKWFILNSLVRECSEQNNIPKRLKNALNILKKKNDIIITKTDKGGKVVIMERDSYINKMNNLLQDINI